MSRFAWSEFRGRARRRVLAGLGLLLVAAIYGTWATSRLGTVAVERAPFDRAIVQFAADLVRPPDITRSLRLHDAREMALFGVLVNRQDALFGLTLLVCRMIVAITVGGLGLVLLTAGSTEWEIRSERLLAAPDTSASRR